MIFHHKNLLTISLISFKIFIVFFLIENMLDSIINATWRPGFAIIRPLINDLVSTAFTKIWSQSFKNFPFEAFIKN